MKIAIGIDIGGTSIKGIVLSQEGKILERTSLATEAIRGPEIVMSNIQKIIRSFLQKKDFPSVQGIGIGTPGRVSLKKKCVVDGAYQLPGWSHFPFAKKLEKIFDIPISVDNDANLMSYGEFIFGSAKKTTNAICITLGTGIGGGIILNKRLYRGSFEYAGEIGHMVIKPNGRKCQCGSSGCWEAYASATGLMTEALEQKHPLAHKYEAKDIFLSARSGDILSQSIVKTYIHHLAIGIINLIRIYDPEIFVIGGGVSSSEEQIYKPLLSEIDQLKMNNDKMKCIIKISQLGNDAGVMGAGALAFNHSH